MEIFFQIILVLLLIIINGFFVASEFALVSIRKTRVDELVAKGDRTAKLLQHVLNHLDHYISSTQLGITIVSLILGWIGEPIIADNIEPFFSNLPPHIAFISSHVLAVIIAFVLITFIDIIFGELIPKNLTLQKTESVAFFIVKPLVVFTIIFKPFIWLLNKCATAVLHLLGITGSLKRTYIHSEDEIKIILSESAESGAIEPQEAEMVYKVFKLADVPINKLMTSKERIIAFNETISLHELAHLMQKDTHSRFPIYKKNINNIIGFVHVKDIYRAVFSDEKNKQIKETQLIRETIQVKESKPVDEVLLEMQKKRIHLGVVLNKHGKTAGIVTMEDLLESVVGEIHDEFEKPIDRVKGKG